MYDADIIAKMWLKSNLLYGRILLEAKWDSDNYYMSIGLWETRYLVGDEDRWGINLEDEECQR
jgi:hypothetical protein